MFSFLQNGAIGFPSDYIRFDAMKLQKAMQELPKKPVTRYAHCILLSTSFIWPSQNQN